MTAEILTEHHLEFLSLKGGCTMTHFWKSAFLEITCHGSYVLTDETKESDDDNESYPLAVENKNYMTIFIQITSTHPNKKSFNTEETRGRINDLNVVIYN